MKTHETLELLSAKRFFAILPLFQSQKRWYDPKIKAKFSFNRLFMIFCGKAMTIFNKNYHYRTPHFRTVRFAIKKVIRLTQLLLIAVLSYAVSMPSAAVGNDYVQYGPYGSNAASVYGTGFEQVPQQQFLPQHGISNENPSQNFVYQDRNGNSSYYNTPSINNYVPSTPTYVAATGGTMSMTNESAFASSPVTSSSGYLAMNHASAFRGAGAKKLEPRAPSYDHWSNMDDQPWSLQLLPDGLIFPSYLAGMKEPRLATMWVHDKNFKWVWDASLGGRAGLLRFGSPNSVLPEGIQLDIEGAVLLRMDMEHDRNMMANDFRAGVPLTFGGKKWQFKFGYYHLSSHMGDEHIERTGIQRLNYVRDSIVFAVARRFGDNWRAYAETAWAFFTGDETEPWEFQVGLEYSAISPARGFRGSPFAAANLHVFQEHDFSGYFCCQAGWQWRGKNNQLFRIGVQYLNGYDDQFEFHNQTTEKIGLGIWYDF